MKPLCFVLMPFASKVDADNRTINFDVIYQEIIEPAVIKAGMEPMRADLESAAGIIHKPMFERILLCEYVIADLTTSNPNVFYELGVRHATKPHTTTMMCAYGARLPFDLAPFRALNYFLDDQGKPQQAAKDSDALCEMLKEKMERKETDSPLYQLLQDYPNIQHDKTDVFREQVNYSKSIKDQLTHIRRNVPAAEKIHALDQLRQQLTPVDHFESGCLVDLYLAYRHVGTKDSFQRMVDMYTNGLPEPLRRTVLVREQYAFALNRVGRWQDAVEILEELVRANGGSSETYGLLGRVYKDRWSNFIKNNDVVEARGWLIKAIDAYRKGFECDWRDSYPGVNFVTLQTLAGDPDTDFESMVHVVYYSALRQHNKEKDYWSAATLLELAFIQRDEKKCFHYLTEALPLVRDVWEPQTTANNLKMLLESHQKLQLAMDWQQRIIEALEKKGGA
jgi:tetratricopeptide (TPR) repeat protein